MDFTAYRIPEDKPQQRELQVKRQIVCLGTAIERLEELLFNKLEPRLLEIAREEMPPEAEETPRPQLVPLAHILFNYTEQLTSVADRLEVLINRLEL